MKGVRSRAIVIAGVLAFVAAFFAYAFWPRALSVDMTRIARGGMIVTIDEEAKTRVHDAFLVSAPVAGRLLRVDVEPGDAVIEGETIVARLAPADASVTAQAEALVDLLDGLSIDRAAVLAISGGAPPALKLAEIAPARVSRMVLISRAPFTPFGGDIETRQAPAAFYSAHFGNDFVYWALLKTARPLLEEAFDARRALRSDLTPSERAFLTDIVDAFLPASRRMAGVRNEGAAVDPGQRYDLEAIKAPTLIISAKDDHTNPHAVSVTLAERIARADLLVHDSGGHLLLGRHAETQAATRAFLTARD